MEDIFYLASKLETLARAREIGYYDSGRFGILPFSGFPLRSEIEKVFDETKTKLQSLLGS